MDKITVLETYGPTLTKTYKSDGTTDSYGDAASFKFKQVEVANLRDVEKLLKKLHSQPKRCLIRGTPAANPEPGRIEGSVARTNASFDDQPLHWFMVDIDGYKPGFSDPVREPEQAVIDFIEDKLPACFKDCSFYWHLSSSAGMPGKEHILKAHVHFWSEAPYTTAQMYAWATAIGPVIDRAIYRRVQAHYTSDPIFEEGRVDPVTVRAGWHPGKRDSVSLVLDGAVLEQARDQGAGQGGNDMVLKDPSQKQGIIGLFHQVFDPETVLLQHLEGEFEQHTERRYTWLNGGGTPEGVWVHDDRMHVGSSHNTWPFDGVANLWDLVREFKFGDLDKAADGADDFEQLDVESRAVGQRASDKAMLEWAEGLPEIIEARSAAAQESVQNYLALIAEATSEVVLETVVAPQIKAATDLLMLHRPRLVDAFMARYNGLTGARMRKATAERMLNPSRREMAANAPDWLGEWVWDTSRDKFVNKVTKNAISPVSFSATFAGEMERWANPETGVAPKAADMALDTWLIKKVDDTEYNPAAWAIGHKVVFEKDGGFVLNSYRPDLLPKAPALLTSDMEAAVDAVKLHLSLILPNARERGYLLDWMAHCVQKPGVKIRWSPLLVGFPGDGKSALIELMGCVLGSRNVRIVNNKTLESDFTGWATGQCFIGVEELKMHNHNRFDIYNSLKPIISNANIEVHAKGQDPVTRPNFSNVLMLSNYEDALPATEDDRRVLFLRTPFVGSTSKEALFARIKAVSGLDHDAYFNRLFDESIREHPGAIRRWLLDHPISPEFNPNGRAPDDTEMRADAIRLSRSELDIAVEEILDEESYGVYSTLVGTKFLTPLIKERLGPRAVCSTSALSTLLRRLGWDGRIEKSRWGKDTSAWYYRGARPTSVATEANRLEDLRQARMAGLDFED